MKKSIIIFIAIFMASASKAGVYCPSDITVSCFSELNLETCGYATIVSGNYHPSQVKYEDDNQTDACNSGQVFRTFYVDLDYSNDFDEGEPFCIQTITVAYDLNPLNIQYPGDETLSCIDEVPDSAPTWNSYPCDLVGYSYEDEHFDFDAGACKKIIRTFTVINWCEYDEVDGEGIYTGTQIIKIIDTDAPEIESCEDIEIDAVANCEATVVLTNSATDTGDCPSGELRWTLSVDLWADGTEDLFFGPNEPQPFRIVPVQNGETVSVELPENVGISNHKIVWTVIDGCGNVRSCASNFEVKDNKPPTPYCKNFLSATLNGDHEGTLSIPVELFSLGGTDNCSSPENITVSFSENVEDKERVIECGETGFQFFRIYYTDEAGNQDFCEVFMLVLDNGSCSSLMDLQGRVEHLDGSPMYGVSASLYKDGTEIEEVMSSEDGSFVFEEQDLYQTLSAGIDMTAMSPSDDIDMLDYKMILDAALGKVSLDEYQRIAADVDNDGEVSIDDIEIMKSRLLEGTAIDQPWTILPKHFDNNSSDTEQISIMDYYHGFDFVAIEKGNITNGEQIDGANVAMEFVVEDDKLIITNANDFVSGPFRVLLNGNEEDVVSSSGKYEITNFDDQKLSISDFSSISQTIEKGSLRIEIDMTSDQDVNTLFSNTIKSAEFTEIDRLSLQNLSWDIIDKRTEIETYDKLNAYPLPFVDQFVVEIDARTVLSVTMTSFSGQKYTPVFHKSGNELSVVGMNDLAPGIYLLELETVDGIEVIKVVK